MKKFNSVDEFINYSPQKNEDTIKILVGKGSCGIAAGANKVFDALKNETEARGIKNIEIRQVGCLGLCFSEPNVEVIVPGLPEILYGKVDEELAVRIIEEHVCEKKIINSNIFDKPYIDISDL